MSTPVVFVHGMYMNGVSWAPWVDRARQQNRGYECHTPSWPYHDGDPAALRAAPPPDLGTLTFGDVIDHLKEFIDTLPTRPVLIGHSIGGLAVQKLLADGYGTAAVSISPAPPQGVFVFSGTFLRANWPHTNPFAGNRPILMTKDRFHYTFGNVMTRTESDAAFDAYVVPESRNVPRSTLTKQAAIPFNAPHKPLLIMAGEFDHLTPRELIKKNVQKYEGSDGVLDYTEFAGRSHLLCNQDGWEDVADRSFDWIDAR